MRTGKQRVSSVVFVAWSLLLGGCGVMRSLVCPHSDLAGIPGRNVRAESPLPVTDRQAFAARIVDPENTNEDDEGDAALAERDFKPVLDAICDPAATFAKLEAADSPLRRAADDPELAFTVVDARAEDVLGRKRAFAVVRGDHVFAIYEPGAIPQQGALVVAVRRAQSFSSCR